LTPTGFSERVLCLANEKKERAVMENKRLEGHELTLFEQLLNQPESSRRQFLLQLGAGAAAAVFTLAGNPILLRAQTEKKTHPNTLKAFLDHEEPFFREFAKLFTLDPKVPYFAIAQKGSMPIPVMQRFKEGLDQIAKDPFPVYLEPSEKTREKIAKSYGARTDEIAISRNTTDAISQVLMGIDWKPGDEILCSTLEYPNCVATVLRVAGRYGVTVRQFGVPMETNTSAEEVTSSIRRRITPGKTKAIFFSAITNPNGQRLPSKRIARLAQEFGIITVVDGAHYGGMIDPKLDETGIDFWGISGHKWQCGPGGTGVLYVRNALLPTNPTPLPRFYIIRSGDLDAPTDGSRPSSFDIGATLSVYGFPESADWRALGEVCELWDVLGRERIQNYILSLADYARQKIRDTFGENSFLQPADDPELKSGRIVFNPFPKKSQRRDAKINTEFRDRLFNEFGIRVGAGGLGPHGLTRHPDPEAKEFPEGSIPNRDPVTGKPAPTDFPLRCDACPWLAREHFDWFVGACQELLRKMI
jgi:isopenicillin-N epimerase